MPLTLEALQVLDTIERRGSFSAAAQALGKVPSALTYTVRRLEDELDVLLFDRRGNRAQLTQAGRELLDRGRDLLQAADALERRVRGVASGWEVELRIAADGIVNFDRLRPLIEDFHRLNAPTQLRFGYEVLQGAWDSLTHGRADLALGVPQEVPHGSMLGERFNVQPMGDVPFLFCVAPHHPLAALPEPLTPDQLQAHRIVAVADTSRELPARSVGLLSGQPILTVATMEQKVSAQLAGLGGGRIPEPFARPYLRNGLLVAKAVDDPRSVARLAYAWRAGPVGKALAWWLSRLEVPRVRERLLAGPVCVENDGADAHPQAGTPLADANAERARGRPDTHATKKTTAKAAPSKAAPSKSAASKAAVSKTTASTATSSKASASPPTARRAVAPASATGAVRSRARTSR